MPQPRWHEAHLPSVGTGPLGVSFPPGRSWQPRQGALGGPHTLGVGDGWTAEGTYGLGELRPQLPFAGAAPVVAGVQLPLPHQQENTKAPSPRYCCSCFWVSICEAPATF